MKLQAWDNLVAMSYMLAEKKPSFNDVFPEEKPITPKLIDSPDQITEACRKMGIKPPTRF